MDERGNPSAASLNTTKADAIVGRALVMVLAPPDFADLFPGPVFENLGCEAAYANSISEAKAITEDKPVEVIILPLRVNNHSVLPLIRDFLKADADQAIIVVSQSDEINDAAEAMRLGALDCIFVPFTQTRLQKTVGNVLQKIKRRAVASSRRNPVKPSAETLPANASVTADARWVRHGMVLSDMSMKPVLKALDTIASSSAPVFIQGETGTGKEVLARALHAESGRSGGPFIVVDCARLQPDTLAKRVFSDNRMTSRGAANAADGVTLFLDGIARTDLRVQKQLMRFLESGEIDPLGSTDSAKVDARIICASAENARTEIDAGRLREDLYYRLHVVPILLPPLRDRGQDILAIANSKLVQTARQEGRRFRGFTADAADILMSHRWPGNVRQLINVVWNIVLHHDADLVTAEMLPVDLLTGQSANPNVQMPPRVLADTGLLGRPLAEIERIVIEETIRAQGGSIPRAAQVLEVSPSTIYRKRDGWARD